MPRLSAAKVQGAIPNRWHVARISVIASGRQARASLPDRKQVHPMRGDAQRVPPFTNTYHASTGNVWVRFRATLSKHAGYAYF